MNSLDLELSILNNEDNIIDFLCECISDDSKIEVLSESVMLLLENTEYKEAVNYTVEYKKLKEQFKNCGDEESAKGIIGKLKANLKALSRWWYKEEPDKKFKTLKLVLEMAVAVTVLICSIKMPGGSKVATKALNSKVVGGAIKKISYKGSKKALVRAFGPVAVTRGLTRGIYLIMIDLIQTLSNSHHDKVNKVDLDNNIKACDKAIDALNSKLSNMNDDDPNRVEVEREVKDVEGVLRALMNVKQRTTPLTTDNNNIKKEDE